MTKILLLMVWLLAILHLPTIAQKKYGYAVLHYRCGKDEPQKDRLYFSPVIELSVLNFRRYTDGMDTAIALYSVRYYNYAISKWLEEYLMEHKQVLPGDAEKYQRKFRPMIFNNKNCNADKTNIGCFFTDKEQLTTFRDNAIRENKASANENNICEVIVL